MSYLICINHKVYCRSRRVSLPTGILRRLKISSINNEYLDIKDLQIFREPTRTKPYFVKWADIDMKEYKIAYLYKSEAKNFCMFNRNLIYSKELSESAKDIVSIPKNQFKDLYIVPDNLITIDQ